LWRTPEGLSLGSLGSCPRELPHRATTRSVEPSFRGSSDCCSPLTKQASESSPTRHPPLRTRGALTKTSRETPLPRPSGSPPSRALASSRLTTGRPILESDGSLGNVDSYCLSSRKEPPVGAPSRCPLLVLSGHDFSVAPSGITGPRVLARARGCFVAHAAAWPSLLLRSATASEQQRRAPRGCR
jgi:hypothetical protein